MKKNPFFKSFILAMMVLFTITACQNDEYVDRSGDGDRHFSMEEYTALLNAFKSKVNGVIDARVKTLTEELNANKTLLAENSTEAMQKSIIATAIELEATNVFKTRAAGEIEALAANSLTDCSFNNLQGLNDDDFLVTDIVSSISWTGLWYSYWENFPLVRKNSLVSKFNALLNRVKDCDAINDANLADLQDQIMNLKTYVENNILLITGILNIVDGESLALKDIYNHLDALDALKANKIPIEGGYKDLIDVYEELIAITDALDERLTTAEAEIDDLQERVAYIEEVEIPAIWEAISFLYDFIGDVYDNLDHRVTGLTFKPEFDYGPGLSSLILVRGLNEWEATAAQGAVSWQQKPAGNVYKGVTWLTYNVSPANATIDFETLELVYTTTTMITRSTSDPLLKIMRESEEYPVSNVNGVLRVPVQIHQDAYPLVQTSFDPNATENIKVALKVTNEGYTAGDKPTRPGADGGDQLGRATGEEDRSVVSSEYVTVWLGLFDGRIAEQKSYIPTKPVLYPTAINFADFLKKDCSNADYPAITLWVGDGKPNSVTVADSVLAVFHNEFEKKYSKPGDYNFTDHTLSYELVDLGNNANGLVTFGGSDGKISVSNSNRTSAAGKTLGVLVKATITTPTATVVHALGYVRVIIAGPTKDLIEISPDLSLTSPVTVNCNAPVEFTVRNTVATFIWNNIINKSDVKNKTNISTRAAFYEKYTDIEIEGVTVTNSTAQLPDLTLDKWKELLQFDYVTTGTNANNYYIKGTVDSEAPMGDYKVVTVLKSSEHIPDLKVTWEFSVRVPQLKPSASLVNGQFLITLPAPSPLITASYSGILNSAFQQQSGKFTYNYLNGTCPDFIAPYFIFKEVPAGYTISEDGVKVLKDEVEAAVIENQDGVFTIRLIEGPAAHGLVGTDQVKVEAKGGINDGKYVIYPAFSVIFVEPLDFLMPTTASFSNNLYSFNFYAVGYSGSDIIRSWDNVGIPLKNNKESAKLLIDYYGINYLYEGTYSYGSTGLGSPIKLDLANIMYASGSSSNFNQRLSDLGPVVTVGQFISSDVEQYYNILTPIRYRLAFNANGATLPGNLRISIPITIEHRWGITESNLVIRVN